MYQSVSQQEIDNSFQRIIPGLFSKGVIYEYITWDIGELSRRDIPNTNHPEPISPHRLEEGNYLEGESCGVTTLKSHGLYGENQQLKVLLP